MGTITSKLTAWAGGDLGALDDLIPLVAADLRRAARFYLDRERKDHSLQSVEIVNEIYCHLRALPSVEWESSRQFWKYAGQLIRRMLVDHARSRLARKRGGNARRTRLEPGMAIPNPVEVDPATVTDVDRALRELEALDARQGRIAELRYFAGMSIPEVAAALEISPATVKREWAVARLWLGRRLAAFEAGATAG